MDGSTVVVTGAAGDLGRAVAAAFAEAGATVVLGDRADSDVEDVAADLEGAVAVVADVRDEFDLERLMEQAARQDGPIDVVVPCASVAHGRPGTPLHEVSYAAYDDTMRTNARGVFAAVAEAVPHLADDARILVPVGQAGRDGESGTGGGGGGGSGGRLAPISTATVAALALGFSTDLDQVVGVVAHGPLATEENGGEGRSPGDVAPMFVWAASEADGERVDGEILDVKTWVNEVRRSERDS